MRQGLVMVNTGNGKGKTTAMLGTLLRAWGRQMRICVIQFLKAETGNWGEVRAARKLEIEWHTVGDGFTWTSKDLDESGNKARAAWALAQEKIASGNYDLIALDEITYAFTFGWLDIHDAIEWLQENKPPELHLIITGRDAPPELIEYADLVTEMREIKHPYSRGILAQAGVDSKDATGAIHLEAGSMRIVTLLPSATEVVAALGLGDQLVAISHECDYPPEVVAGKPIITRSVIPPGLSTVEIDRIVSERIHRGESLYTLDFDLLEALKPDLIITQELCEVCAVSAPVVRDAICRLSTPPQLISLEPTNIAEIFETLKIVAQAAGVPDRAPQVIEQWQARLARLAMRLSEALTTPRVLTLEWLMPPFSAGHWVPEMVERAGGVEVVSKPGERSARLAWETVFQSRPDIVFMMPCGYSVDMIEREFATLHFPSEWWDIPAVRRGNLFAVNANSYFSCPSPRIVEGIEILAALLHPELFPAPSPSDARRMVMTQVVSA